MFKNSTLLITGGSGSWGMELTQQFLKNHSPKQVRIYSRGEAAQVRMRRLLHDDPRLRFIVGDVRDLDRLKQACRGVDYVFHLAALKHVPVCEENPYEAVRTNVIGTQNVIDASIRSGVKKVIDVSSDKAASPLNLYGTTKSVGEKLFISANMLSSETTFICIRAGNVLGTMGSVVPLFRSQILRSNLLTITDESMTRFFMNLDQVVTLVLDACREAVGGEIFVLEMPAMKIGDLAEVMQQNLGNATTTKKIIGKRPGEKVHEILVSRDESERTYVKGKYFVILPMIKIPAVESSYDPSKLKPVPFEEFSSNNTRILNHAEIKTMLDNEHWLSKKRLPQDDILPEEILQDPFKVEGWTKKK
ncbi:MAG: polysaccharide biosynthesis protein [Deltaproteobacteria bacterium]|nr:polysaccharide biosynthesis protein [Deltaproteobacteria bacterium]